MRAWVGGELFGGSWRLAGSAVLLVGLWSTPLGATPPAPKFSAPAGCPSNAWFASELAGQGVPETRAGAIAVRVELDGGENPGGPQRYVASAQTDAVVASASGAWQRKLVGKNCKDLLSALAMSFALHLESERAAATPSAEEERASGDRAPSAVGARELTRPADTPAPTARNAVNPLQDSAASGMRQRIDTVFERQWRWGVGLGAGLRTGVDARVNATPNLATLVRASEAGWGSGPYSIDVVFAPRRDSPMTGTTDGQASNWQHSWWAVGAAATPGTFTLADQVRIGPTLAFHVGRYHASFRGGTSSSQLLMFTDLRLHADRQFGAWLIDGHVGLHLPVRAISVVSADDVLHKQAPGLVVGLAANWLGVVL